MTLISYASSGGDKGRCDARCYNATHDHCECICGGKNHRKGLAVASAQTAEWAQSWLDAYKDAHPGQEITARVTAQQLPLAI